MSHKDAKESAKTGMKLKPEPAGTGTASDPRPEAGTENIAPLKPDSGGNGKIDESSTEAVLNHLLFHKSLINDIDSGQRINQYMDIVRDLEKGIHIAAKNPFDKSVSIAFELVMQQHFDPWDIDLIKFSKIYLEKAKGERDLDFVTAGRLIFMAWSILKMQSDEIVSRATPPQDQQDDSWSPQDLNIYDSTEDLDYTTMVMNGVEPPLQEMLRRQGTRPVTLMELVDAFDEAKKDSELRQRMLELRRNRYKTDVDFGSKVHREDLGEDICMTWNRILQYNGSPIPLSSICDCSGGHVEDRVTVFVSVLFLAHMKMVKLSQKKVPAGEIFVQNISNSSEDISELVTQAVALESSTKDVDGAIPGSHAKSAA